MQIQRNDFAEVVPVTFSSWLYIEDRNFARNLTLKCLGNEGCQGN